MKFIAKAGLDRICSACRASEERVQDIIRAPDAGEHQIFVKGRFESSRVGDAKNGVGPLNIVGESQTRLRLAASAQTIVLVATDAQIERPVFPGDGVLDVDRQFLYICVQRK